MDDLKPFDPNEFIPPVIQDLNYSQRELPHVDVIKAAVIANALGIDPDEYIQRLRIERLNAARELRGDDAPVGPEAEDPLIHVERFRLKEITIAETEYLAGLAELGLTPEEAETI
jgi:hypothetical protein